MFGKLYCNLRKIVEKFHGNYLKNCTVIQGTSATFLVTTTQS